MASGRSLERTLRLLASRPGNEAEFNPLESFDEAVRLGFATREFLPLPPMPKWGRHVRVTITEAGRRALDAAGE